MARQTPNQTNFTSGEQSLTLLGRTDIERYFNGAEVIENMVVRQQGGVERRLGTKNIGRAETQTTENVVRLVPFVYSRNESVSVEISAGKFRFIQENDFIRSSGTPISVSVIHGTATAIPYTNADINELQFTQSADVIYITHPDHPPATLSRYGATDWRYEIPDFDYGPYMDQEPGDQDFSLTLAAIQDRATLTSTASDFTTVIVGDLVEYPVFGTWALGRVVAKNSNISVVIEPLEDRCLSLAPEVYSPGLYDSWDTANSTPLYNNPPAGADVQVAFSNSGAVTQEHVGNYLRFMDKDGVYRWMIVEAVADIVRQGAYGIIAIGDVLNPIVPSGIVTRSARSIYATMYASDTGFFDLSEDVGRLFRLVLGGKIVHARTVSDGGNNGYTMKVLLNRSVPISAEGPAIVQDGTTNDWNAGAWFPGNYPSTCFFHEERLGFAGTYYQPQTGWLSKTGDFYNFATTDEELRVLDDSAITFTVAGDTVNQILWAVSKKALVVGAAGGEWAIGSGRDGDAALTPFNISVHGQSAYGSAFVKPVLVGKSLLYLQQAGRKLRRMEYNQAQDVLASIDMTVFADHIMKDHGGGTQLAYQLLPESVLYVLLGDGQVGVLTYEEDQQVFAWSRFKAGGPSAVIESICCLPEGSLYRLYMVVRRTINGSTVRTIESLLPEFRPSSSTDYSGVYFMDNYITAGVPGSTAITGLSDYAGTNVTVRIDDTVHHNVPVNASGELTLPSMPTSGYAIGFSYRSILKPFPPEVPIQGGSPIGRTKRISQIHIRIHNTMGFSFGESLDELTEVSLLESGDNYDTMPPMRSIDKSVTMRDGYDNRGQFYLVQDNAYPLTVLAITLNTESN